MHSYLEISVCLTPSPPTLEDITYIWANWWCNREIFGPKFAYYNLITLAIHSSRVFEASFGLSTKFEIWSEIPPHREHPQQPAHAWSWHQRIRICCLNIACTWMGKDGVVGWMGQEFDLLSFLINSSNSRIFLFHRQMQCNKFRHVEFGGSLKQQAVTDCSHCLDFDRYRERGEKEKSPS